MATTTTTTPNAPDLLTLVTDTESIVSSIDTLTSYLDSELAPSTAVHFKGFSKKYDEGILWSESNRICRLGGHTQAPKRTTVVR